MWILSCQRRLRFKLGCTKDLCCYLFFFAVVVDVVTGFARVGALSELLYADDLVLVNETMEGLRNRFIIWKETFESMGLNVNIGKTNVMVCGCITKDGKSRSNVDPCGVCSFRVRAITVLCLLCGMCIHGRCAGMKWS